MDLRTIAVLGTSLVGLGGGLAWWLGRRSRRGAVGPDGRCLACDPTTTEVLKESPFRLQETIADEPHHRLSLAVCRNCKAPAVQYSVDLFDDSWTYWCPLDEGEKAKLLSIERGGEHEEEAIRRVISMIRERRVLQRHPDTGRDPRAGLRWVPGGSCLLEGPPW